MSSLAGWVSFSFLSIFWGCSFIAIRFSVEAIPPFAAAFLRIFIAAALLTLLALVKKIPFPSDQKLVWKLAGIGIFNFAFPWACLFWGEQYIQPALASIINSTVPLFVLLWSWFLLADEQPTFLKSVGVTLGFVGIMAIFAPSLSFNQVSNNHLWGMLAVVAMSISYAIGSVFTKKVVRSVDITWNISIQGFFASIILMCLSLSFEGSSWISSLPSHPKAIGGILYLAIISTALAWLIFYRLLREWGAIRSSTVTYVAPFVSIAVDWFYFHQLPTTNQMVGALLILSGIYLIHVARQTEAENKTAKAA